MPSLRQPRHNGVSDPLSEDGCPLCGFLKEFQSRCLRSLNSDETRALCTIHTWLVASGTQASAAAEVFLHILDDRVRERPNARHCDLCARIAREEHRRIEELVEKMHHCSLQQSLHDSGRLCIPHGRKILDHIPKELQGAVDLAIKTHADRLREKLTALSHSSKLGTPIRAGILGRVAEYLVAQRGLGNDA